MSKNCLAEFAAVAANKVKSIFDRGVYLGENTYQAACVEFVRHGRTNYARSRLQKTVEKPHGGFSTACKPFLVDETRSGLVRYSSLTVGS